MASERFQTSLNGVQRPIIGMIHAAALPGSPAYGGSLQAVYDLVLGDTAKLAAGGVHALMIENFGDAPFFPGRVPAETVAHLTALAAAVRREAPALPLGINMLRNDGLSALGIAHAVGAKYVRVNVLCGARVADQGLLQGIAHDLQRLRKSLGAESIAVLADVDVKHSSALAERALADEVDDTLHRGMADGLIVSGAGTGKPTDLGKLKLVKQAAKEAAVLLGSGVSATSLAGLWESADGFIVGTTFKKDGLAANEVDVSRVKKLMEVWHGLQR